MSLEVRPYGVKCNIRCTYCYQNDQRLAGNLAQPFDMEKVKARILEEGRSFCLFGGEVLLLPLAELEDLLAFGFEHFGRNNLQTNATLITDAHVTLFRKYNVSIGISCDGPGDLSSPRWAGSETKTRKATETTEENIRRLLDVGLNVGVIATLHRKNASPERLPLFVEWLRKLDRWGLKSLRVHNLEIDNALAEDSLALSMEENIAAFLRLAEVEEELKGLRMDLFSDARKLMLGSDDHATCVWKACDPYTTEAVMGVEGSGQLSNCGRTNKDGIDFLKSDDPGFERNIALYHTPQKFGGCQGCRYFLFCKGQCPGTGIDRDWRNRSVDCALWKEIFRETEENLVTEGLVPITRAWDMKALERSMVRYWERGLNPSFRMLDWIPGDLTWKRGETSPLHPNKETPSPSMTASEVRRLVRPRIVPAGNGSKKDSTGLGLQHAATFFDGRIAVGNDGPSEVPANLEVEYAPADWTVLNRVSDLLEAGWPELYDEIAQYVDRVSPLRHTSGRADVSTSWSDSDLRSVSATTHCPIRCCQALVLEAMRMKYRSLATGEWFENPLRARYRDPFFLQLVPFDDLLKSLFCFLHILRLEGHLAKIAGVDERALVAAEQRKNWPRVAVAFEMVRTVARPRGLGGIFLEELLEWGDTILGETAPSYPAFLTRDRREKP